MKKLIIIIFGLLINFSAFSQATCPSGTAPLKAKYLKVCRDTVTDLSILNTVIADSLSCTQVKIGGVTIANPPGGTTTFLRGDGTFAIPPGTGGSGSVTSVSVVTANGVSGSVATSTTTPAITLTLGAIAPSSVNNVVISGSATPTLSVTGPASISGVNTGDQITTSASISYTYNSNSTSIIANQGVAYDGTNTYLTSTGSIEKRNSSFVVTNTNSSPFTSITGTVNHCGDGEINGAFLYVPVENYTSCGSVTNIRIVKYNSSDLSFSAQSSDLSSNITEMSALTIIGDTIYCASFCNLTNIKKFNRSTLAYIGSITISYPINPVDGIQGITNDGTYLYLSTDNSAIYAVSNTGGLANLVYSTSYASEIEGIDYNSNQLRWLVVNIDGNSSILKLDKSTNKFNLFSVDQRGNSYLSGSANINNSLTVGYQSITSMFPAISVNTGKWTKVLFSSNRINTFSTIGSDHTGTSYYCNGYYNGTAWTTADSTKVNLLYFQNLSSFRHEWRYAPASSTVTWTTPFIINSNPIIGTALLTTGDGTINIGSSGNRIASLFSVNGVFSTSVNLNGASTLNNSVINTLQSNTNPQISLTNSGTGGQSYYLWSTNNSNGSGGGKFLLSPSSSSTTGVFTMTSTGSIGIKGVVSPTATLHLAAGTSTANTAPLKFTSGTNLTTPEAGSIEYNGSDYFATTSIPTRYNIDKSITASATLDFPSTTAGNKSDLTITVTGAAVNDVVLLGAPNSSVSASDNVSYFSWVSAINTVTVRFNNDNTISAVDPASGTFKIRVIQ